MEGEESYSCLSDGTFGKISSTCRLGEGLDAQFFTYISISFSAGDVKCEAIYPDNGFAISDVTSYEVGDVALFECFPGYQMSGSPSSICQPDGKLSVLPKCNLDASGKRFIYYLKL